MNPDDVGRIQQSRDETEVRLTYLADWYALTSGLLTSNRHSR